MEMMTTFEFLNAYMRNRYEALTTGEIRLSDLVIDCCYCPLREQCAAACEAGSELDCVSFIQQELIDGNDYHL